MSHFANLTCYISICYDVLKYLKDLKYINYLKQQQENFLLLKIFAVCILTIYDQLKKNVYALFL